MPPAHSVVHSRLVEEILNPFNLAIDHRIVNVQFQLDNLCTVTAEHLHAVGIAVLTVFVFGTYAHDRSVSVSERSVEDSGDILLGEAGGIILLIGLNDLRVPSS